MSNDWALGKRVKHEEKGAGRVVAVIDPDPESPYLNMRYEDDDGTERELVAHCSTFEVVG